MTLRLRNFIPLAVALATVGCAQGANSLSTASVATGNDKVATAAGKVDPACVTLASQIETLRNEGTIDKLEKASSGKSANVQIKRAALAKQAELNKANADFQTRCGPSIPKAQTAAATPVPAAATSAVQQAASNVAQTAATTAIKNAAAKSVAGAAVPAVAQAVAGQ